MYIKTDGIVLRGVAYQDSDKLLTVLTREYGKLTVRARGVRSSRSRSKAACQLLAYSEFTLLERGGRYVVTEATAKEMFPELRNDLELLSLASYFAQAADVLSPEGEENPPFVSLLLNALYALGRLGLPQKLVKAAFATLELPISDIEVSRTDRGSELDNAEIDLMLETFGIERSLSAKGCPYDNAVDESTNKILKAELVCRDSFSDLRDLQAKLSGYVRWHNNFRIHSTLGYMSPVEFRKAGLILSKPSK